MEKEQLIKLGKAIEYIRDNYQRQIKVNEIAEYAGLTPKGLNRIMSEKYGYTFAVLLRKYRLYQAASLLHFDYIPIDIVARRCGFQPNYFFNEFKKEFGFTPKEMKEKTLFPDMPMFKNINGSPLSLEYKIVEDVTIEGYLVRIPKEKTIDLMWDVAYGFRHPNHRNDLRCSENTWGIWWADEKDEYRTHYLMGQKVDPKTPADPEKVRMTISGGKYAVFSVSRGKNYFDTANNAREMTWHAFYSWQILSKKETDKWGFTYEMFDEEKAYLYIPLISGYGGIEREKEISSHTIDHIIKYIDENILTEKDFDKAISKISNHDIFYREQFQSCYNISLSDYIWKKKLYVLAQKIYAEEISKIDIARKYRFGSIKEYEKEFKKAFGVPSCKYQSVNIDLINMEEYYEENFDKIAIEKVTIPEIRMVGKIIKSRTDRKSIDLDLPQMTAYWMKNKYDCLLNTPLADEKRKIAIFHAIMKEDDFSFDYVLGPVLEQEIAYPEELEEITIASGDYYVFSYKFSDGNLTEEVRNMIRCIDHVWMYRNWMRTDFTSRVCFYYYDGSKVYYYVPVYG
ncbi:MAG: helix-turn-helix domain-containing protein [Eubacteriales bacterium]|nr:helix-turn-helix domain-containing protein [Eubacteriales bacterium]